MKQTTRFVQLGGIFSRQLIIMATRCRRRVLDAISSLGDDGVVVNPEDHSKFEALIGDYFNDSDGDCDESGSEDDVECGKIVLTSHERSLHSLKFQTWSWIIAFRKILNQVLLLMLLQMLTHPCFAETSTINDAGDERYHEGKQL